MKQIHTALLLSGLLSQIALLSGCGDDEESTDPRAEIDTLLTVTDLVGGDFTVATAIENCSGTPPAAVRAGATTLVSTPAIEPVTVLQSDGGGELQASDDRARFFVTIPSSALDPAVYGLPVRAELVVEVACPEGPVESEPVSIQYVPTDVVVAPPQRPNRFWASDVPGDLLVCSDSSLVVLEGGTSEIDRLNLGFPCTLAEVDGVIGERRYVWGTRFGIAALDPGPSLTWTRSLLLTALWSDGTRDPIVLRTEGAGTGTRRLYVLDAATGADLVGPVDPTAGRSFLDAVARAENGDILVLESETTTDPASLTYYVRRLDSAGNDIITREAARYNYEAERDIASFSFDGSTLFYKDAPDDADTFRIAAIDTLSGAIRLLTTFGDPWRFPLGDAFDRLLVASENEFLWLDPDTGDSLSSAFGSDGGNTLRFRTEADGSVVMLADSTANAAQGLYVFEPDGTSVMRFTSSRANFTWLAVGWEGTTLFSYFNEVHLLPPTVDYAP